MLSAISLFCLVSFLTARASAAPVLADWAALASDSTAIIVGIAEKEFLVVNPRKMATRTSPLPNGRVLVELPKRDDYVQGRLIRIRIVEVLKRDAKVKVHGVVSIFVPGATLNDLSPAFEEHQQYLVFLSRLAPLPKQYDRLTIHHDAPSAWEERFNPDSQYIIVGHSAGLVHLTEDNRNVIDQVRAALLTARVPSARARRPSIRARANKLNTGTYRR